MELLVDLLRRLHRHRCISRIHRHQARRRAQLHALRPDLQFAELRGNIDSRLDRARDFDAIVLAVAGVERIGRAGELTQRLDVSQLVPQVGQGALAVECRDDDHATRTALELIDHHLAAGDEVWIVSSSPAEIVEPFADIIGVTGAIASRAEVDERGRYTGRLEFFCQGDNKAVAMRALASERSLDLANSSAYSDSETDVAMLTAVGHPFAVNPDRSLARIAQDNSWPTLVFSHPVRARDRRTPHTPYVVGAIVLAALAVVGRRTRRRREL